MKNEGVLFIVATPIGNLDDMTLRAIKILKDVDLIAAEDTRHSGKLLHRFGISTSMVPFHQHNQTSQTQRLIKRLCNGDSIALISDAGTPLVSDPGLTIVRSAHKENIKVVPIPGASALTSALSVCGIASEHVVFEGFLPAKSSERLARLKQLSSQRSCLVFFETPHRIIRSLQDIRETFEDDCETCIAREMTKMHEVIRFGALASVVEWASDNRDNQKGEFVIVIDNTHKPVENDQEQVDRILNILLQELSARKAAELAARILGMRRNALYKRATEIKNSMS